MNMKKTKTGIFGGIGAGKAIALAAALAATGMAPVSVPAQNTQQGQTQNKREALDSQIQPLKRQQLPELMPGGGRQYVNKSGLTPKQYGQWLQSTGRQKWIKKAK
jgi:hypothetical protein